MAFIGRKPTPSALTSSDIADDIITEAKMANDAISLTELKAGTDGELITWDASGNPVAVGAGTSGHFLKSQGAGSVPVFAEASGGGKVLQVVSATKTDTQTVSSADYTDITGLTVNISPAATSSKVLVLGHITVSGGNHGHTRCVRGSTVIGSGTAASSRGAVSGYANSNNNSANLLAFVYLDSPSTTSSTTYHFELESNNGAASYINRTVNDTDAIYGGRGSSTITVMEIGA